MNNYKVYLLSLTNKELELLDQELHNEKIKRGIQKEGKKPATSGLEWLWHSMTSFNGNKTRTYSLVESSDFVDAYINYKKERNQMDAVQLATNNYDVALEYAEQLLSKRYSLK